ncbi:MAG: hypothetical protein RJA76_1739 [Bacteroidota bacterium]
MTIRFKLFNFYLFIFLIFLYQKNDAQISRNLSNFEFLDKERKIVYQLDISNNLVKQFRITRGDTLITPLQVERVNRNEIPTLFFSNAFPISATIYWLTVVGTGQVYEFDLNQNKLKRLDRTYFRGHNFSAIQFYKNDTLFSFGGMGFWHSHNIATYYDKQKNEWELYFIGKNGPARYSTRIGGYIKDKHTLYTAELPDLYEDQEKNTTYIYSLDLDSKKWNKLGTLNKLPKGFWDHDRLEMIWIEPFFFSNELEDYFIDPIKNKVYALKGVNKLIFQGALDLHTKGNYIYRIKRNDLTNSGVQLDSISIKDLVKNSEELGSFYTPIPWWQELNYPIFLISIFALLCLVLCFYLIRFKKKIKQFKNGNDGVCPEFYEDFISFILQNEEHLCSTNDLNDIIQVKEKPLDTQRQYRSRFISQVNQYLQFTYGISEGIERASSISDKRFVFYKASSELLKKFKGN